jgi:hypothetical protein
MAVQEEEVDQVMKPNMTEYHEWDDTQPEGHKLNQQYLKSKAVAWHPEPEKTT